MTLTRTQRRANIQRALSRVRASGGGVVSTGIRPSKAIVKGYVAPPKKEVQLTDTQKKQIEQKEKQNIRDTQKIIAQRKIGNITRIVTDPRTKEVSYIGSRGQKYTFPSTIKVKFTGKERFGGINSIEMPLPRFKQEAIQRRYESGVISRAEAILQRQYETQLKKERADKRFFLGKIPQRTAEAKQYKDLTKEEKLSLLPSRIDERLTTKSMKIPSVRERVKEEIIKLKTSLGKLISSFPREFKTLAIGVKDITPQLILESRKRTQLNDIKRTINLFNNLKNLNREFKNRTKKNLTKKDIEILNNKINTYLDATRKNISNLNKRNKDLFKTSESRYLANSIYGFSKGILSFPIDIVKGMSNILLIAIEGGPKTKSIVKRIADTFIILRDLNSTADTIRLKQKIGKKTTQQDYDRLRTNLKRFKIKAQEIKKNPLISKRQIELFNKQETRLAAFVLALAGGGAIASLIGGTTATITGVTLKTVGVMATTQQSLETIKKPTPENFGRLVFLALPTAISILKTARKLGPNFRPSVKNVSKLKSDLSILLKNINKAITESKRLGLDRNLKYLSKLKKQTIQGIKEMNWIIKNPEFLKTTGFNPLVHTRNFKKLQGSYKSGIHVSSQTKVSKLFGQKIEIKITKKELGKLLIESKKSKIDIGTKTSKLFKTISYKINRKIADFIRSNKIILSGSKAMNMHISKKFTRQSGDYDVISNNPSRTAKQLLLFLKKQFPNVNLKITRSLNAHTIRLNNKGIIDVVSKNHVITQIKKGKWGRYKTTNIGGYKVLSKESLLAQKLLSFKPTQHFKSRRDMQLFLSKKRQLKDIPDIVRLLEGKVKLKGQKIIIKGKLPTRKNPSNVFEVADLKGGMGKDRIKFGENHMYWDFEGALSYSQGKAYSIIMFPITKISKFPKSLRLKINLASKGKLSNAQSNLLRKQLNNHIKNNPNKFFLGPRTASLPIGEREIVLAVSSKFIKGNIYKTFDNDLQRFISIIEVGFNKSQKINIFRKFYNGWKNNPFRTLKYKLSNPDIAKIRKYTKLLEKGFDLNKQHRLNIIELMKKMLKSKKGRIKITKKQQRIKKISKIKRIRKPPKVKRKITIPRVPVRKPKPRKVKRVPVRKPKPRKVKRVPKRIPIRKPTRIPKRVPKRIPIRKPTRIPKRVPKRIPTRAPTRIPTRAPTRAPKRVPVRIPKRVPTKKPTKITKPPKPFLFTWDSKLPRGKVLIVNVIVRIKGINRELKLKTTPFRALRKIIPIIDNTTTRSFQLKIIGTRKGTEINKPKGLSKFRIKKSRGSQVLRLVEKTKHAIDTRGEKRGLKIAKQIKKKYGTISRKKKKPTKKRKNIKTKKSKKKKR